MKHATHPTRKLPNYYGGFCPIHGVLNLYLTEFILFLKNAIFGPVFDILGLQPVKIAVVEKKLIVGDPKFIQRFKIHQSLKYGAILYITAAMLAIPSGICSNQHATPAPLPTIAPPQIPPFIALLHESVQAHAEAVAKQSVPPFYDYVIQASQAYGVDAALIRAVIMAESSYNPRAVSHRGAQGLMQLMPTTAKWLGVKDSFNPAHNIDGGVRYLRRLLDRFKGDVELALAAYNAGSRHVRNYGGIPPFKATRIYIKKVLRYRQQFEKEMVALPSGMTAG